jgi:hypothetical protein
MLHVGVMAAHYHPTSLCRYETFGLLGRVLFNILNGDNMSQ